MAHDRLRRAVDADEDGSTLVNGSKLFVDAGCILLYSQKFFFKYYNESYDIFNMTDLKYTMFPDCKEKNVTDRYMYELM